MRKSANLRSLAPTAWVIGGCHGNRLFLAPDDDETGARSQRQFLFANCIVLTLCVAIVAFAVALVGA